MESLLPLMQTALRYVGQALLLTAEQLLILLGPSLLLAWLMHLVSEAIRTRAGELLGERLHIWLTAPGTVVHELGHALFCVLFGHQIKEISLFRPRPNGVLGFVTHSWNRKSLLQNAGNFFIGTGPIWLGTACILLLTVALLGTPFLTPLRGLTLDPAALGSTDGALAFGSEIGHALFGLLYSLADSGFVTDWHFWLFLYLLFCIGSHVTLSASDLSGAVTGLLVIVGLALAFNLATLWLGDFALAACLVVAQYGVLGNLLLLFALVLNGLLAGVLLLLALLRG